MLFSGLPFLYYFLPAVLLCYFAAPQKLKNTVLLLFSLLFYAWGEPVYVFLMLFTITAGYILALLTEKHRDRKAGKAFVTAAVVLDLLLLGLFKYADFFVDSFNAATGFGLPLLRLALPVGISFYTFQIISYNVEVWRGTVPAQRNFVNLACYVTMFPQLIAGPIVRYGDIAGQLEERRYRVDRAADGVSRFLVGLGKKVLLANTMGEIGKAFQQSGEVSQLWFWLYALAFSLQIYYDFSGYSDMAIGLGKILGFEFVENFNYPYISRSITEFWRRWHISLGSWFRDYVYIPLGGNRVRPWKWYRNIFVVWLLTGFWHGAAWNFMVWGLYFGLLLVLEKKWLLKGLEKLPVLGHVYVLFLVLISFVIFNAESMGDALRSIGGLFGYGCSGFAGPESLYTLKSYALWLLLALVGVTPWPKKRAEALPERLGVVLRYGGSVLLLLLCTAYLVDGSFNPFLYFRF